MSTEQRVRGPLDLPSVVSDCAEVLASRAILLVSVAFFSGVFALLLDVVWGGAFYIGSDGAWRRMPGISSSAVVTTVAAAAFFDAFYVAAFTRAAVTRARNIDERAPELLRRAVRRAPSVFLTALVRQLTIALGCFVFVAPGMVLYARYVFAESCAADGASGTSDALERSTQLTSGRKVVLFVLFVAPKLLELVVTSGCEALVSAPGYWRQTITSDAKSAALAVSLLFVHFAFALATGLFGSVLYARFTRVPDDDALASNVEIFS